MQEFLSKSQISEINKHPNPVLGPFTYSTSMAWQYRELASRTHHSPESIQQSHQDALEALILNQADAISPDRSSDLTAKDIHELLTATQPIDGDHYPINETVYATDSKGEKSVSCIIASPIALDPQLGIRGAHIELAVTTPEFRGQGLRTQLLIEVIKRYQFLESYVWRADIIRRSTLPPNRWRESLIQKYQPLQHKISELVVGNQRITFSEAEVALLISLVKLDDSERSLGFEPVLVQNNEAAHFAAFKQVNYARLQFDQWRPLRRVVLQKTSNQTIMELHDERQLKRLSDHYQVPPTSIELSDFDLAYDESGAERIEAVRQYLLSHGYQEALNQPTHWAALSNSFESSHQTVQPSNPEPPAHLPEETLGPPNPLSPQQIAKQLETSYQQQEAGEISFSEFEAIRKKLILNGNQGEVYAYNPKTKTWNIRQFGSSWQTMGNEVPTIMPKLSHQTLEMAEQDLQNIATAIANLTISEADVTRFFRSLLLQDSQGYYWSFDRTSEQWISFDEDSNRWRPADIRKFGR